MKVACLLYKLGHGANDLECNEHFVINNSSMNMVLHEFVFVINIMFLKTKFNGHEVKICRR
jgi:hypothetical protein